MLLGDILRHDWAFKGFVTSDCGAIRDIYEGHHFTKSLPEAAAVSLKHGVDTDCADFGEGAEAGAKAGMTEGAAKVALHRAMKSLTEGRTL